MRRPFEKIVSAERREKARAAARRQHMIGACQIVAQRRRRIRTEKHRSSIANLFRQLGRLPDNQLDVFRRYRIGQLDHFFFPTSDNNRAIFLQ